MKAIKLSDIKESKRSEVIEKLALTMPEPAEEFNDMGLRFPMAHLNLVGGSISLVPMEYAARYVDVMCKEMVAKNHSAIESEAAGIKHGQRLKDDAEFRGMNSTSIGNIAYIILNHTDKEVVEIFTDYYNAYAEWYWKLMDQIGEAHLVETAKQTGLTFEEAKHAFEEGRRFLIYMRE